MPSTRFTDSFAPIAVATRNGFIESLHHGVAVVLDRDGAVVVSVGDPRLDIYPRSSLKPLQADAMLRLGLELPPDLLALACATHSGEPAQLEGVLKILALHDLSEADLRNTPARPHGDAARSAARDAGIAPSSLQQNCSGKHAAMLATCRINGWPTDGYLSSEHPLQAAITERVGELSADGEGVAEGDGVIHTGIDGCGAPTHVMSVVGLARAYSRLVSEPSDAAVAMAAHPEFVGGADRDVTVWMSAVPGLIAKEGAAGVMAAALPDGRSVAFKIADGADSARQAVTVEAMRMLGVDSDVLSAVGPTVGVATFGHGLVVGELRALNWSA